MAARTSCPRKLAFCVVLCCGLGILALIPARAAAALGKTFWERKDGPFRSQAVIWNRADLTVSNLTTLYADLSKTMRDSNAWTVSVFVDEGDAMRELYGKLATEEGYDRWSKLYNEYGRHPLPMAEIYYFEGSAVLRLRSGAAAVSETILSGEDFLRVRLHEVKFEILQVYYHPLPPNIKATSGDEAMISVYVRASVFPSHQQAKEFCGLMRRRFRQKRIQVAIRTDSYFLLDSGFPIVYRFDPDEIPLDRAAYQRSRTIRCFSDHPEIVCRVH